MSPFEVHLDASHVELSAAIGHLLQAAHWHAFSVVSDLSASAAAVRAALRPTSSVVLRADATSLSVFHRLAELQRATRGVVVLLAEAGVARRVLVEAQRLHMLSSDWVWLLVDRADVADALRAELPIGMLRLRPRPARIHLRPAVRAALRLLALAVRKAVARTWLAFADAAGGVDLRPSCFRTTTRQLKFANKFSK